MVTKSLLLSYLLMVPGQVSQPAPVPASNPNVPAPWYVKETSFKIPIKMSPQRLQSIKQIMIYVSDDEGKNWRQYASAPPTQRNFIFNTDSPGVYGFRVVVINLNGQQEPENIFGPPNMVAVVDTVKPQINLSTERVGDEVIVRWNIDEENPDVKSMKLQFQSTNPPSPFWSPVAITPSPTGEVRFKVEDPNALTVQLQLMDLAKNLTIEESKVPSVMPPPKLPVPIPDQPILQENPEPMPIPMPVPPNPVQENKTQPYPQTITTNKGKTQITDISPKVEPTKEKKLPVASTKNSTGNPATYHKAEMKPRKPLPPVQLVNKTELNLKYR